MSRPGAPRGAAPGSHPVRSHERRHALAGPRVMPQHPPIGCPRRLSPLDRRRLAARPAKSRAYGLGEVRECRDPPHPGPEVYKQECDRRHVRTSSAREPISGPEEERRSGARRPYEEGPTMDWYSGLLAVVAGVVLLLSRAEIRQERQRRESMWEHLMSAVGHIQDSSGNTQGRALRDA